MPVDPNDVAALIENLVDAYGKAIMKGVRVRVDDVTGEMSVSHEGVDLYRVLPTGEVQTPD